MFFPLLMAILEREHRIYCFRHCDYANPLKCATIVSTIWNLDRPICDTVSSFLFYCSGELYGEMVRTMVSLGTLYLIARVLIKFIFRSNFSYLCAESVKTRTYYLFTYLCWVIELWRDAQTFDEWIYLMVFLHIDMLRSIDYD